MKKRLRITALLVALCLVLSLGSLAMASDNDWADYQKYIISFAEAGAPTPADAEEFTATILASADMESLKAGTGMGVIFDVMGAMTYDDWTAAGKPAADTAEISGSSSGEASGDKTEAMPSAEKNTGVPAAASPVLTVFSQGGQLYVKSAELLTLLSAAG